MSKEKRPFKVQEELEKLNNDESSKEVAFNPQTGELEIVDHRNEVTPNATIVTDVANDGFAG
ncbi:hypothetical protein [Chryseobacterium sp. SL1]|uniref:hypothetical protein n=1 Tax=Chryseobacterium sp. SL1 TaxID=2995159 RepID=UPI002276C5C5|nr:hypothetical protein [Chryseobacterium sp. SL1]MCY1660930.1 hypothetical protein [Chryseobacterium sp. SL1]